MGQRVFKGHGIQPDASMSAMLTCRSDLGESVLGMWLEVQPSGGLRHGKGGSKSQDNRSTGHPEGESAGRAENKGPKPKHKKHKAKRVRFSSEKEDESQSEAEATGDESDTSDTSDTLKAKYNVDEDTMLRIRALQQDLGMWYSVLRTVKESTAPNASVLGESARENICSIKNRSRP